MDTIKIWNDVSSSIGFYTKETAYNIPDAPGIYAWVVPLWMYSNDVYELVKFVQGAMLYDSDSKSRKTEHKGKSEREGRVEFNWDYLDITLKKNYKLRDSEDLNRWNNIDKTSETYISISESLMKASVFTKPLYIGRADNLSVRYSQHVEGTADKNLFHIRFKEFIEQSNVKIDVDDLLFICVPITQSSNNILKERNLTSMLESILMNIVHPPFSCK